ncbi:MAG: toll/interleukin-1 receptor domain-containing protein [Pseudomonadota bacterium]
MSEVDFFISRRGSLASTAQEVAAVMEAAGYSTAVQDHDIPLGDNFVSRMHAVLKRGRHLVVICSKDYEDSGFTWNEFSAFFREHLTPPDERRLVILRVDEAEPGGVLAPYVFADLVSVEDAKERRALILAACEGRPMAARRAARHFLSVPPRNALLTGRADLLARLKAELHAGDRPAALTQAAVHGLGGVGKTALATEYAHAEQDAYAGVAWIPAEGETERLSALATLGAKLEGQADLERTARAALDRVARADGLPWLLVYDNVPTLRRSRTGCRPAAPT